MKIIHTSDWHIGAELNSESLDPEFKLFRNWLTEICIPETGAEILLVAGDVFDKANPSAAARKLYFETLLMLHQKGIRKLIITGGNHDSPLTLDAPADLLKYLDIHVVGGVPSDLNALLIPLENSKGTPEALIAAVPFLRDSDIRTALAGQTTEDRETAVRLGIRNFYQQTGELCQPWKTKGIPVIVCGHLFATGVSTSDSERAIQVGNEASVDADIFPEACFDYVALGHIHRPQRVGGQERIRYSGSPIALSFSERSQKKTVILLEIESGNLISRDIEIPVFRQLIRLEGRLEEIQTKLSLIQVREALPAWIEIRVTEPALIPGRVRDISIWMEEINTSRQDLKIVSYRYSVLNSDALANQSLLPGRNLHELSPAEVFEALLQDMQVEESRRPLLSETFMELLEIVQQQQK